MYLADRRCQGVHEAVSDAQEGVGNNDQVEKKNQTLKKIITLISLVLIKPSYIAMCVAINVVHFEMFMA